jgi:6-phosphofructokinase 1
MNAAIRAVVRTGLDKGWDVYGVRRGYAGLVAGSIAALTARDVGGIIHQGGTMLGSARCREFAIEATPKRLDLELLRLAGILAM